MRQSKVEIYIHAVWSTKLRARLILPAVEVEVYAELKRIARERGCQPLAVDGMPDHVHVVLRIPSTISVARLLQRLKGETSNLVRNLFEMDELFQWQEGYAAFSVSRSHLARVIAYVENQKRHHANGTTWPEWEETDEAAETPESAPSTSESTESGQSTDPKDA